MTIPHQVETAPRGQGQQAKRVIVRRAPLVPAAVTMAAGIIAGRYVQVTPGAWALAAGAAIILALAALRRQHLHALVVAGIAAGVFCLAGLTACLAYWHVPENHIVTFSQEDPIYATIRGQIITAPMIRRPVNAVWEEPKTTFLLQADGIRRHDGAWLETQGLVRVTVDEPAHELPHFGELARAAGARVELVGSLSRTRPPSNPGQYDWQQSDRYRGILVRFRVPAVAGVTVQPPASAPASAWWDLRRLARRHMLDAGQRDDAVLLEALVLGDRDPSLEELNRAMVEAGTAHMLSISGQHMAIFLGLVYLVFRLLMFPPRRSAVGVLIALVAYVMLTEVNAPLLRSAVMASALCIAVVSGRAITTANALAGAGIVLLLLDPLGLFRAEFQLSFGIVSGMVVLYQPVKSLLFGRYLRRRGLMVFRGQGRWRRWLHFRAANGLIALACLSLSAYAASAPLVAYHFGLFSPYAPVLSAALSPLMALVLVPAYASLALAWPMPNVSAALADWAAAAAGLMRQASLALERLPGISFDLYAVPPWLVWLFYAAVLLWVLARRGRAVMAAATAATLAAAVGIVLTQQPAPAPAAAQLHVLDVAHGAMNLLQTPDGKTILLDAGTLGALDAYHQVLRPFLRQRRLPSPEVVFVSHANIDHYNALPGLIRRKPPKRVYVNEYFAADAQAEPEAARLLADLARRGVQVRRIARGDVIQLGTATVEVLWPPRDGGTGARPGEGSTGVGPVSGRTGANDTGPTLVLPAAGLDANDTSLVLRIVCGRTSASSVEPRRVLIPGDATELAEVQLVRLPPAELRADVLVLPHHGSLTPTLKKLVAAVDPELVVQSNSFRQAPQELLRAIAPRPRYATFLDGWIGLSLGDDAIAVQTMRQR